MADENETKIRDLAGVDGTESPVKSPVGVRPMSAGFIYLILSEDQDAGKIGWSRTYPAERLMKAQTNNPAEMVLDAVIQGGRDAEQALHQSLAHLRIRGEWFRDAEFLSLVFSHAHEATIDADDEEFPLSVAAARQCVAEIATGHSA